LGGGKSSGRDCGVHQAGVTTRQIDNFAAERIKSYDAKSAFLGYRKFPGHTCLSVNDEVVHGIASDRELKLATSSAWMLA